jgi:hypothetical protein
MAGYGPARAGKHDGMTVDEALHELATAEVVAFGPVGFAAATLPVTWAFHSVAVAFAEGRTADLRTRLEWLLAEGTPAGKAYAATLLAQLDPAAGRAAWQRLSADRDRVTTFSGCIMNTETLAEYAADHLSAPTA